MPPLADIVNPAQGAQYLIGNFALYWVLAALCAPLYAVWLWLEPWRERRDDRRRRGHSPSGADRLLRGDLIPVYLFATWAAFWNLLRLLGLYG